MWLWLFSLLIPVAVFVWLPRNGLDVFYRDAYYPLPKSLWMLLAWLVAAVPLAIITARHLIRGPH